ncbi:Cobalamin biosynthesis protein CobT VWA domain containing protein [uncultured Caudovirales phage]|uniref:Cobalamin biosynthesis protein CobT VWA domain containing protein n=1 Tax=uncultured Caudovirales phage TaxID=2100421 RepID=A0A6J7X8D2_9CAUD|nr:Cobalamin biosynthesis protein CobT VWA domain containing protein [uncultured Caudovirales phage]CAB4183241.1 Cobalamin biosynthesis protein CobT VWA domain containing protein [uncultured Caudovirales phage]CAB4197649.1 Cobalamin biosynthesis protein CobT VWA domain containing protein [uncultured Caudovirales phage]CAB4212652.1 Cobalamin biosynthesis protein CobT VWA domain containing protein [uncultured Caudovirales phage]CAB5227242.1 Cobalamin biosynthesis protein CobT VWA domain containin
MLNPMEMERYIAATAKRANLKVVWEVGKKAPRTDADTMFLPAITSSMTEKDYREMQHMVGHEVRHQLHTNLKENSLDPTKSLLGGIWNSLEDHRVDYLDSLVYEGDRLIGDQVHSDVAHTIAKQVKAMGKQPNELVDNMLPVISFTEDAYKDIYPSCFVSHSALAAGIPDRPKAVGFSNKLTAGDYGKVLRNIREIEDPVKGSKATLDLASRIFEEVYGGDAEKEKQRMKKEAEKAEGEGKPKEGKKAEDGDGEEGKGAKGKAGEGEGEEGKDGEASDGKMGKGEGDGGEGKTKKVVNIDWSKMLHDVQGPNKSMTGQHINFDKHEDDYDYIPCDEKGYDVHDFSKPGASTPTPDRYNSYSSEIANCLAASSPAFAHQVRTVLQVRARDHYYYGKKQGKLHNGALYRIPMTEAEGFNSRVFKKKEVNNVLDAAVTVLIDTSGSMSGVKYTQAAAAGIMLNETIGNTLHIPLEVIGFTTPMNRGYTYGCGLFVHRSFTTKMVSRSDMLQRFTKAGDRLAGNPDGDAIIWAFDRIIKRPEKRKLIIVCSDGAPSGGGRGDEMTYTKKVVREIETLSPVDIVGIGIQDSNVTKIYKENYVIKEVSMLEKALLSVIKNKLK